MHLHSGRLVLEEARHDKVVASAHRDGTVDVMQLAAQVAERKNDPAPRGEAPGQILEDSLGLGLLLEVGEGVAHANGQLDIGRDEPRNVTDVTGDGLDRQPPSAVSQLGEQALAEVDGEHAVTQAGQADGLKTGAAAEVHGQADARRAGDAQSLEQGPLLGNLGLEIAEHPRVVRPQHLLVMIAHRAHGRRMILPSAQTRMFEWRPESTLRRGAWATG